MASANKRDKTDTSNNATGPDANLVNKLDFYQLKQATTKEWKAKHFKKLMTPISSSRSTKKGRKRKPAFETFTSTNAGVSAEDTQILDYSERNLTVRDTIFRTMQDHMATPT